MNNLILMAIMLGLSFFNETDTKIVAEPEMVIEETVEVEREVVVEEEEEELKEDDIQMYIDSQLNGVLTDVGFKFSVDGYKILDKSTIIFFSHSVNKDAIKDIGSITVRMNWELEDGRTGGWEKIVYTKVHSISYEEQSKTTFPIITHSDEPNIVDASELNNARLHFFIKINKPIY